MYSVSLLWWLLLPAVVVKVALACCGTTVELVVVVLVVVEIGMAPLANGGFLVEASVVEPAGDKACWWLLFDWSAVG